METVSSFLIIYGSPEIKELPENCVDSAEKDYFCLMRIPILAVDMF